LRQSRDSIARQYYGWLFVLRAAFVRALEELDATQGADPLRSSTGCESPARLLRRFGGHD
jgi:hypothetical protein